jgi:hypothetical protein
MRASPDGLERIKKARIQRADSNGRIYSIENPYWLVEASKILVPNQEWTVDRGIYAIGLQTWKRFLAGVSQIRPHTFEAFCEMLGLKWEEVCEENQLSPVSTIDTQNSRRGQENICYKTMVVPGSLLRIRGPRSMGAKQLLNRLRKRLRESGSEAQVATINFQSELDSATFFDLDKFAKAFCCCIRDSLEFSDDLSDYWNTQELAASNHKISNYFRDRILPNIDRQLILILEGVDRVFEHSISNDFCELLRGWFGEAQSEEEWQKLSLVIAHSTDIYVSLGIISSPLDGVGVPINLQDFTLEEIADLAQQYDLSLDRERLARLMQLVGGNPYLIDCALRANRFESLELLLSNAATENGIYRDRLSSLWRTIKQQPLLIKALKLLVISFTPVTIHPSQLYQLSCLGLVRKDGDTAVIRYELYRIYFDKMLSFEGEIS